MKKTTWLFLVAFFLFVSCSKKVELEGKITGGASPLERVEIIEASGVATLPLINVGVDKEGRFSGSFEAPKNGMYVISYAGQQNLIYLKQGQKLKISGNALSFPGEFTIEGDAKNNNDFLKRAQKAMEDYTKSMNMQQEFGKDEASFVKFLTKTHDDLTKKMDEIATSTSADKEVVNWKKNDLKTGILALIPQYTMMKKQMTGNMSYKSPKVMTDFEEKMQENPDDLVKNHPLYRQYYLSKLADDFSKYVEANKKEEQVNGQLFNDFIKQRKEISQTVKDYLLAFVVAQYDISPVLSAKDKGKLKTIIDNDIKEKSVKEDLKKILFVVGGHNVGDEAPKAKLKTADDKEFKIESQKGKPTLLIHYASWTPSLQESAVPVIRQMVDFYKSKFNFVFVNFDDTTEQFKKTSESLLKGLPGVKVYSEGGLKSDYAEKYGMYGFKLSPGFLILDKNGKIAGRTFYNAGDPEFVALMDKLSGLKAPEVQSEVILKNDLMTPPPTPVEPSPQNKK